MIAAEAAAFGVARIERRSTTFRWLAAALVGAATLAVCAPAWAYVRTRTNETKQAMFWDRNLVKLEVLLGDPPALLDSDDVEIAARSAAEAWNTAVDGGGDLCSAMQLQIVSSPKDGFEVAVDEVRTVQFRRDSWSRNTNDPKLQERYPSVALAITSVFASKSTGEIVDVDVEVNAVDFIWGDLVADPDSRGRGAHDLQNTLTHEFGHVIGLDHTCSSIPGLTLVNDEGEVAPDCDDASTEIRATTMFASVIMGDTERRTLAPDDMKGICEIYPLQSGPSPGQPHTSDGDGSSGCAIAARGGTGSSPTWWAGIAIAMALAFARRRRA